jgi:DNA-binding protein HU-beta
VTKQEFVDRVAAQAGLSKSDAGKAVEAFLDTVQKELTGGGQVNFTGFGKFSAQRRAARMGVNPRTGEKVQIPAATVPKFQAGSSLKSAVKAGGGGGYSGVSATNEVPPGAARAAPGAFSDRLPSGDVSLQFSPGAADDVCESGDTAGAGRSVDILWVERSR